MGAETNGGARPRKKKRGRVGEVRCHNCSVRFWPAAGTEKVSCPNCGWEWYISWSGKLAKIRKPVWESWERQLAAALQEEENQEP
jgi:ribosomal protein S26